MERLRERLEEIRGLLFEWGKKPPMPKRNDMVAAIMLARWLDIWGEFTPDTLQVLKDLQDDPEALIQALQVMGLEPSEPIPDEDAPE